MVATLQALSDRGGRGDELIAAGEVLNLRFQSGAKSPVLSLRASKLLHFLVNAAGADACELKTHSISAEKLNEQFHLSIEDLLSTVRELFQAVVQLEYRTETGRRVVKTGPMLADVERDLEGDEKDPALIRWEFSPVMRLVMSGSDHWAALSKKAVLAFSSRYALRLYEILSLRKNLTHKNTEVFELDDLRQRFGIEPGTLSLFSAFRRTALEPAIAEVNQLTGLRVSYDVIKRGRGGKVHSIVLDWKPGTPAERAKVARELAPCLARGGIGTAGKAGMVRHAPRAGRVAGNVVRAAGYRDPVLLARLPAALEARVELPLGIIGLARHDLDRVAPFDQRFG